MRILHLIEAGYGTARPVDVFTLRERFTSTQLLTAANSLLA
jgi:PleD family two-component response regulator